MAMSKYQYQKDWVKRNKKRRSEYIRRWREKNKDHLKKYNSKWWKEHKSKYKGRYFCPGLREQILEHYDKKCICCGETHKEFLCIDHIGGGGKQHRKKVGSGYTFYKWIIKNNFPKTLRILCHNCNMAMGIYGYCPHQTAH